MMMSGPRGGRPTLGGQADQGDGPAGEGGQGEEGRGGEEGEIVRSQE